MATMAMMGSTFPSILRPASSTSRVMMIPNTYSSFVIMLFCMVVV
jgi:hypothetical protein